MEALKSERQRRADGFEALVRPHLGRLYGLAHHLCGCPDQAEDLVQSLLLRLYARTETLPTLDRPGPWLARALYNLFIDQCRSRGRQPVDLHDGDEDSLDRVADSGQPPEALVARLHVADAVREALAQLSPAHRAVVTWHDIEGYTLEELAVDHAIPVGTLKSRLHRARARLRELLTGGDARAAEPSRAGERV